jgi:hypothetical protein
LMSPVAYKFCSSGASEMSLQDHESSPFKLPFQAV